MDARLTRILLLNQAVNGGALCNNSDLLARRMLFQARGGNIKIRIRRLCNGYSKTDRHWMQVVIFLCGLNCSF
jgi:hypothetical protein